MGLNTGRYFRKLVFLFFLLIVWVGTIVKVSVKQQKEMNSVFTLNLHKLCLEKVL